MEKSASTHRLRAAVLGAVAAAGLAGAAAGAPADSGTGPERMVVRLSDLDVCSPVGARVARSRIALAAEQFCGTADPRDLARATLARRCRERMVVAALGHLEAQSKHLGPRTSAGPAHETRMCSRQSAETPMDRATGGGGPE